MHRQTSYKLKPTILAEVPFSRWNIPKKQAQRVVDEYSLFTTKIVERSDSAKGDTTKLLIELQDGHQVETVVMRHVGHATVCVSSQIGCQMGCR
jgi:23S rRNA (adenine2503-C2)-methyltransferase